MYRDVPLKKQETGENQNDITIRQPLEYGLQLQVHYPRAPPAGAPVAAIQTVDPTFMALATVGELSNFPVFHFCHL